jgi:hypothetical protein
MWRCGPVAMCGSLKKLVMLASTGHMRAEA